MLCVGSTRPGAGSLSTASLKYQLYLDHSNNGTIGFAQAQHDESKGLSATRYFQLAANASSSGPLQPSASPSTSPGTPSGNAPARVAASIGPIALAVLAFCSC